MAEALQPSRGRIEQRLWEPRFDYGVPRRHRRAQLIDCCVPAPIAAWEPALPAAVAAEIAEADAAVRALNRELPVQLHGLEALARQLLRQESVGSSRIEGLVLGQRRLARAAAADGAGDDETARQIVANVHAMEAAIARATALRRPTVADLLAVHRTLFAETRDAALGGVVRVEQNWVGGSAFSPVGAEFVPPPPELVGGLLDDLVAFLGRDDLPVAFQAAVAHAQFETIHPFLDGNGRVGRCLIHVVQRRRGVAPRIVPPVSLLLATRSAEYVAGLTAYRFGELADWLGFFAQVTVAAAERARQLADRIDALVDGWLEQLGRPRSDASARLLAERLPAEPILTVARAAEIAGVSNTAADRAVRALERAGVVAPLDERRWGRRWEAGEVFTLLDAFERELATPVGAAQAVRPAPR